MQTDSQNGETKNHAPKERIGEIFRKRVKELNEMKGNNLLDIESKIMVIRKIGKRIKWQYIHNYQ